MDINSVGFKPIKKLLKLMFAENYTIEKFEYSKGEFQRLDGLGSYSKKPTIEIIVINNDIKYKLDFYKSYQLNGDYWYWNIKHKKGIRGTCFFEGYNEEKIKTTYRDEHETYLYMYKIK